MHSKCRLLLLLDVVMVEHPDDKFLQVTLSPQLFEYLPGFNEAFQVVSEVVVPLLLANRPGGLLGQQPLLRLKVLFLLDKRDIGVMGVSSQAGSAMAVSLKVLLQGKGLDEVEPRTAQIHS